MTPTVPRGTEVDRRPRSLGGDLLLDPCTGKVVRGLSGSSVSVESTLHLLGPGVIVRRAGIRLVKWTTQSLESRKDGRSVSLSFQILHVCLKSLVVLVKYSDPCFLQRPSLQSITTYLAQFPHPTTNTLPPRDRVLLS